MVNTNILKRAAVGTGERPSDTPELRTELEYSAFPWPLCIILSQTANCTSLI